MCDINVRCTRITNIQQKGEKSSKSVCIPVKRFQTEMTFTPVLRVPGMDQSYKSEEGKKHCNIRGSFHNITGIYKKKKGGVKDGSNT